MERKNPKDKLTKIQYEVTQKDGTEPPFQNEYWNHKEEGIYVDIVSGEPLFSSHDKFEYEYHYNKKGQVIFKQPTSKDEHIRYWVDKNNHSY